MKIGKELRTILAAVCPVMNAPLNAATTVFEDQIAGSTVRSIALGGALWSGDGTGPVLDQWFWRRDNAAPFTTFAAPVPEPSTAAGILLGAAGFLAFRLPRWWKRKAA